MKRVAQKTTNLTRFIERADCAQILNANFRNPIKRSGAKLLIQAPKPPPALDFGAIGHAYDYWVRLRICPVSEESIEAFLGYRIYAERYSDHASAAKLCRRYKEVLLKEVRDSESFYEACLFFAKFEAEFRSGLAVQSLIIESHNVAELERLARGTDLSLFREQTVVPNPMFCVRGSRLRITADGDIIVGTTLIDLKTSSSMEVKANLRQLIGYVILNDLGSYNRVIDAVGLYYPRFSYFVRVAVRDLMTDQQRDTIRAWFSRCLGKDVAACS